MFKKILIANRGEIACRIIKTCRQMGIQTVAVFSEVDKDALHTQQADEAIYIGAAPAAESYLSIQNIISAAKQTGAEAIHPGYGFLSENTAFAGACAKENIVFIGPPAEAIEAMGDKAKAKTLMEQAGVPLVPGAYGVGKTTLKKAASEIGMPVLLKAVAGGGGKGMRVVEQAHDFDAAYGAAQREGENSFGNGELMVEKYLATPRHVEVQVFADGHGHCVHLFERDCSLQRRHQKVVEEAPAPHLSEALRAQMGKAAVEAAKAVGYVGAGTVEFLLEGKSFFFMEMNTRLQVEHPVTEAITGLDLVAMQIRVAAGESLPFVQNDVHVNGHSIEVRLYAEDPSENFMPSTGTLLYAAFPEQSTHVRVDTGVGTGDNITHHYDPMLAKIITWGQTRGEALNHMTRALNTTHIVGVAHNIAYLERIIAHQTVQYGTMHTKLLQQEQETLLKHQQAPDEALVLAALYQAEHQGGTATENDPFSPWQDGRGWRLGGAARQFFEFAEGNVQLRSVDGGWQVNGDTCATAAIYGEVLEAGVNGKKFRATVVGDGGKLHLLTDGFRAAVTPVNPLYEAQENTVLGDITAPLPGKVVKVLVAQGASVKKGGDLMLIEAMKTEHHMTAPSDGTVTAIYFNEGDNVNKDQILIDFTPEDI